MSDISKITRRLAKTEKNAKRLAVALQGFLGDGEIEKEIATARKALAMYRSAESLVDSLLGRDSLWVVNYEFLDGAGGAYLVNAVDNVQAQRLVRQHYVDQGHMPDLKFGSIRTVEQYADDCGESVEEVIGDTKVPGPGQIESLWAGT